MKGTGITQKKKQLSDDAKVVRGDNPRYNLIYPRFKKLHLSKSSRDFRPGCTGADANARNAASGSASPVPPTVYGKTLPVAEVGLTSNMRKAGVTTHAWLFPNRCLFQ